MHAGTVKCDGIQICETKMTMITKLNKIVKSYRHSRNNQQERYRTEASNEIRKDATALALGTKGIHHCLSQETVGWKIDPKTLNPRHPGEGIYILSLHPQKRTNLHQKRANLHQKTNLHPHRGRESVPQRSRRALQTKSPR